MIVVTGGEMHDVAVDLRCGSPGFGQWNGVRLSAENRIQFRAPEEFTHGFVVLSDHAEFLCGTTDYRASEQERCIAWNDPELGLDWPLGGAVPISSTKNAQGLHLHRRKTPP